MNCGYCTTRLFDNDRCCPKCGAPIIFADFHTEEYIDYDEYSKPHVVPTNKFPYFAEDLEIALLDEGKKEISVQGYSRAKASSAYFITNNKSYGVFRKIKKECLTNTQSITFNEAAFGWGKIGYISLYGKGEEVFTQKIYPSINVWPGTTALFDVGSISIEDSQAVSKIKRLIQDIVLEKNFG